ncbi:hypothetical protein M5K25_021124 [Dendrobium thyrsiflorum]|uniref:Uncharacterized protein n=1 Tax=Dendrobium thyrsiflorum TaxID=117978 RepID=A0ABD0UIK9_DENTH
MAANKMDALQGKMEQLRTGMEEKYSSVEGRLLFIENRFEKLENMMKKMIEMQSKASPEIPQTEPKGKGNFGGDDEKTHGDAIQNTIEDQTGRVRRRELLLSRATSQGSKKRRNRISDGWTMGREFYGEGGRVTDHYMRLFGKGSG